MDQFETTAEKQNDDESALSSVPKIIRSHPRALGLYWDLHSELSYLGEVIGELMFGGDDSQEYSLWAMVRFVILVPSAVLLLACRIPFVPLDIYDGVRWLKLSKKWDKELQV